MKTGVVLASSPSNALTNLARRHPCWLLFGLALLFRLVCSFFFKQPGYSDAYYYSNVAESLWRGRGFREDYIWNYLGRPLPQSVYNNPASVYWLPLTAVLIYAGYLLGGGPSFLASQIPIMLISSALAPLTYYLAKDIFGPGKGEIYGWLAGLLMIFCGIYAPYFCLPDNFAPFALLTLLVLMFNYKALRLPPGQEKLARKFMVLAGICSGLSYLTRVDGVLLLGIALLTLLLNRYWLKRESALNWSAIGLMWLAFGLTLVPWLARNLIEAGQLFPGGGLKVLFLREYDDFFSYAKSLDLPYYFNQTDPASNWGIGPLLGSKLEALFQNLAVFGRATLFFMLPLFILGLFSKISAGEEGEKKAKASRLWLRPEFLPFSLYLLVLYFAMSLIFTFPGTRGSLFHSSGGLLPFFYIAIVAGLDVFVEWLGTISRPKAGPARWRTYSRLLVAAAAVVSLGFTYSLSQNWDDDYQDLQAAGEWLNRNGAANAIVMTPDVPAYYYVNQKPAIVMANDSLATNLEIARRYGARFMILQRHPHSFEELAATKTAPGYKLLAEWNDVQIYHLEY